MRGEGGKGQRRHASPPGLPRGTSCEPSECEQMGSCAACRAVAPAVAPAPLAVLDGTSGGDNRRHQLAAEALVNMANQEPCSQEPPYEPMPLAYGTPVEHVWPVHSQPLLQPPGPALLAASQHAPPLLHQYGPYNQYAALPYSIAPQPPSPYSIAPPPPPMDPYSIAGPPPPPPMVNGFSLQPLPVARGPFCSILLQPPLASAPSYSIVPQPAPPPMSAPRSLRHAPAASECLWNAPPDALQKKFERLVMCNFTTRRPRELPTSRWVSLSTLYSLFHPHNRAEVWLMGPGNLKQLITKWYKDHPTFAGLDVKQWCKRLSNKEKAHGGGYVFKFCFEHTPNKAATI